MKQDDGWERTAGSDSSFRIDTVCLDPEAGRATLVVTEGFLAADRFELALSAWKVGIGSLVQDGRWNRLIDPSDLNGPGPASAFRRTDTCDGQKRRKVE